MWIARLPALSRYEVGEPAQTVAILFAWPPSGPHFRFMRHRAWRRMVTAVPLDACGAAAGDVTDSIMLLADGCPASVAPYANLAHRPHHLISRSDLRRACQQGDMLPGDLRSSRLCLVSAHVVKESKTGKYRCSSARAAQQPYRLIHASPLWWTQSITGSARPYKGSLHDALPPDAMRGLR